MALIIDPVENNFKKIHYFRKEHFNYYKQVKLTNSDEIAITLNDYYTDNYLEGSGADGIHFFNITADATLYVEGDTLYSLFSCTVRQRYRNLAIKLPIAVSGKVFVRVSFDVYYYTIEEDE